MAIYFISDLHLHHKAPHLTQLFLHFLKNIAQNAQVLYILGDLFETWIGDDHQSDFNRRIIRLLKQYSKTTPTFIMQGNRDFLLSSRFCQESGCQLLEDPTLLNLYGTSVLLTHGDALCTLDERYMAFRKKARDLAFQQKILSKPLWLRKLIAFYYRHHSKKYTRTAHDHIMDAAFSTIKSMFLQYEIAILIHGHTHRPGLHFFYEGNELKQRIILSDWHLEGNYLICYPDGSKLLKNFTVER